MGTDLFFVIFSRSAPLSVLDMLPDNRLYLINKALATGQLPSLYRFTYQIPLAGHAPESPGSRMDTHISHTFHTGAQCRITGSERLSTFSIQEMGMDNPTHQQKSKPDYTDDVPEALSRARGCLLGQLAGDALGSLVEFQTPEQIRAAHPRGVRQLADGGTWNTIAGQPTDDSEMALLLARMLVKQGKYDQDEARKAYLYWLDSGPFDCGTTILTGLRGQPDPESQANGALMRISPLGIFGVNHDPRQITEWAELDAALTHPHPICRQANALFVQAIAYTIRTGTGPWELHEQILRWAKERNVENSLLEAISGAAQAPPEDYVHRQGWVLIAFRNALWQLLHAPSLEDAVVDTIMRGGDTDTNAAICGALLGSVHGQDAIPGQWAECLLNCRPENGKPGVRHPRPECLWPVDAPELAKQLLIRN